MGELINLNKVRKARSRAASKTAADANRASFGRTKAQKLNDRADQVRADKLLDGARLDE